jgi:Undecaprenyl-phosphate galactose phosphotransferase WbaP
LSTQPANEAARPVVTATRPVLTRPHLVGKARRGMKTALIPSAETEVGAVDVPGAGEQAGLAAEAGPFLEKKKKLTKRVLDVVGVLLLGLTFAPLMIFIVVMLSRDGGPVLYRHKRIGRGGQPFECLKFRTMVPDAERVLREILEQDTELKAEWVRDHKLKEDPRVTSIGRMLRRTSLDELPQLWNVLRGEMSLVGPRPVVREELLRYGRDVGIYLAALPGITGLWQVTGRNDTDYQRRVQLDTYYVCNQNLLLDLYILVKTTGVVLGGTGAY